MNTAIDTIKQAEQQAEREIRQAREEASQWLAEEKNRIMARADERRALAQQGRKERLDAARAKGAAEQEKIRLQAEKDAEALLAAGEPNLERGADMLFERLTQ